MTASLVESNGTTLMEADALLMSVIGKAAESAGLRIGLKKLHAGCLDLRKRPAESHLRAAETE